jgi:hypothetical protein
MGRKYGDTTRSEKSATRILRAIKKVQQYDQGRRRGGGEFRHYAWFVYCSIVFEATEF